MEGERVYVYSPVSGLRNGKIVVAILTRCVFWLEKEGNKTELVSMDCRLWAFLRLKNGDELNRLPRSMSAPMTPTSESVASVSVSVAPRRSKGLL